MSTFRTATAAEVDLMLDWAAAEGWNPGLDDAAAFHAADPDGFFVAVDDTGPVACISVVNHTDDFAFLGLYIAQPSVRGQGIGYGLWQHALTHAGTRTIGLDGVPDQQANYAASGFQRAGSTARYTGQINPAAAPTLPDARPDAMDTLIAQEAAASGVRKDRYLRHWFTNTGDRITLIDPEGFCTVRRCRTGAKVGPLVAQSPTAALRLLQEAATCMGPDLIIDVPESAADLAQLVEGLGFVPGFATARMYRGDGPVQTAPIYAVTTLELG